MSDLISSSESLKIAEGLAVTLHFSILLPEGDEVDSTRRGKPATFVMGDGNLLPGFEAALLGLVAGSDEQLHIAAANAFGERVVGNVQRLPRNRFPDADELEVGLIVSFAAPDGELPGVVQKIWDDTVEVDFNHPLAGRDLVFDVSILKVEPVNS